MTMKFAHYFIGKFTEGSTYYFTVTRKGYVFRGSVSGEKGKKLFSLLTRSNKGFTFTDSKLYFSEYVIDSLTVEPFYISVSGHVMFRKGE